MAVLCLRCIMPKNADMKNPVPSGYVVVSDLIVRAPGLSTSENCEAESAIVISKVLLLIENLGSCRVDDFGPKPPRPFPSPVLMQR